MRNPKAFFLFPLMGIIFLFLQTPGARAFDMEGAIGIWSQEPSGTVRLEDTVQADTLDIEDDLRYDREDNLMARLRLDLPAFFPNLYLMATRVDFDGTGSRNEPFRFGDELFLAGSFESKLKYDHYDISIFYSIPLVKTATLNTLNIDLGLNGRVVDLEAQVLQGARSAREDFTRFVPMLFAAAQVRPVKFLSIEGEFRGLAIDSQHIVDLIGRVKVKPVAFLFIAGGYRFQDIEVDQDDIMADFTLEGPFAEVGAEF